MARYELLLGLLALAMAPVYIYAGSCGMAELLGLQAAGEAGRVPYVLGLLTTSPKCAQCLIKCQGASDKQACAIACMVFSPSA
jgi:hypothetical protein